MDSLLTRRCSSVIRGRMTGLTALCSAKVCGATYSILIDEHARIVSHTP